MDPVSLVVSVGVGAFLGAFFLFRIDFFEASFGLFVGGGYS